jgi:hypothetical protein
LPRRDAISTGAAGEGSAIAHVTAREEKWILKQVQDDGGT